MGERDSSGACRRVFCRILLLLVLVSALDETMQGKAKWITLKITEL